MSLDTKRPGWCRRERCVTWNHALASQTQGVRSRSLVCWLAYLI